MFLLISSFQCLKGKEMRKQRFLLKYIVKAQLLFLPKLNLLLTYHYTSNNKYIILKIRNLFYKHCLSSALYHER